MFSGIHVKYRCYSCQILIKLKFSRQLFEKYSNIKLHENSSSVSRFLFRENRPKEMTKLTVNIRNFANTTKKVHLTKANGFPFSEILYLLINIGQDSLDR